MVCASVSSKAVAGSVAICVLVGCSSTERNSQDAREIITELDGVTVREGAVLTIKPSIGAAEIRTVTELAHAVQGRYPLELSFGEGSVVQLPSGAPVGPVKVSVPSQSLVSERAVAGARIRTRIRSSEIGMFAEVDISPAIGNAIISSGGRLAFIEGNDRDTGATVAAVTIPEDGIYESAEEAVAESGQDDLLVRVPVEYDGVTRERIVRFRSDR